MSYYEVIVRLALAILIGGIVGYEREYKNRPAGFRTHILVCVGATVVSMIQIYDMKVIIRQIAENPQLAGALKADIGRLGAQVVTGVGFLGAGTIIRDKGSVKGLTTAASLWTVACIGLAVGLGYYFLSIVSTVAVFIALVSLKKVEARLIDKRKMVRLQIEYFGKEFIRAMQECFESNGVKIKNIEFDIEEEEDEEEIVQQSRTTFYTILIPRHVRTSSIIQELSEINGVTKVIKI
ncbi:hypothetical protein SH2C18_27770 [Clostridium sediminicola]|uniref:MgtC/SapB family protein n=1 Tax=Clostridium sediminicola TaxID=3114879 RepID=UPI0031F1CCA0